MNVRNTLVYIVGIFALVSVPYIASAQTATTTIFSNEYLQKQIDDLTRSRLNLIQTPAETRATAIRDYLKVETIPSNPGPNETITVSIESYLSNLDKAILTWSVNGSVLLKGIGKRTLTFKNGGPGSTTRLDISIITNEGESVVKSLAFSPVGVTLLWEANTYTPPFYKGKALPSPQAEIRAMAIPDLTNTTNALDAGRLVYVWAKDGSNVPEFSGYGKNSFTFKGPRPYSKVDVRVRVSSINDAIASEMKFSIPLVTPFILFYEQHPLLGVWYNRPIGDTITLSGRELSLSAEPFFFSNSSPDENAFRYTWTINGSKLPNTGRVITLQNTEGKAGTSKISFAIQGLTKTFQAGSRSSTINFTENLTGQQPF